MPYKFKKTNIQYDVDIPEEGYIVMGFDEQGKLVTKNDQGDYEPIISDVSTGNFQRLEVDYLTVGNRVSGVPEGLYSIAQGLNISASGDTSFAQGNTATASGVYSFARGEFVEASGLLSFVSGRGAGSTSRVESAGLNSFVHMRTVSGGGGSLADDSAILGGIGHNIGTGANQSTILGGTNNTVNASIINSVVLGGASQTATASNTVYLPRLVLTSTSSLSQAGSIYFDGSNFYGHNGSTAKQLDKTIIVTNQGANRIVTSTSTVDTINAHSDLTWDGSTLNVGGTVRPSSDNVYDLGTISYEWRNLYIDGTAFIDTFGGSLIPAVDNNYDLGSSSYEWRNLYIDGTAYIDAIDMGGAIDMNDNDITDVNSIVFSNPTSQFLLDYNDTVGAGMYWEDTNDDLLFTGNQTVVVTAGNSSGTYFDNYLAFTSETMMFKGLGTGLGKKYIIAYDSSDDIHFRFDNTDGSPDWNNGLFEMDKSTGKFTSQNGLTTRSDGRLKHDVNPAYPDSILSKIENVDLVSFRWIDNSGTTFDRIEYGVIAQDLMNIFPEHVVEQKSKRPDYDTLFTVSYEKLSIVSIKGLQEIIQQNRDQQTKIDELEQRIYNLENPA